LKKLQTSSSPLPTPSLSAWRWRWQFDDDGKVAYDATGTAWRLRQGHEDNAQEFLSDVSTCLPRWSFLTANVKPPTTEVETVDAEVSDA
jgi:hypothetical protein